MLGPAESSMMSISDDAKGVEMHLHVPKNIDSLRKFIIELLTITCGIVIALGLESAVESWRHHREAGEARERIHSEMRDNMKSVDSLVKEAPGELANLKKLILLCQKERARRGSASEASSNHGVNLSFTMVTLRTTAWSTAQSTGIVSYIPYEEAAHFTSDYAFLADVVELQQKTVEHWMQLQRLGALLENADEGNMLRGLSDAELARIIDQASETYSYTEALSSMAGDLKKTYVEELAQAR